MGPGDAARLYHQITSVRYPRVGEWTDPYKPPPSRHALVVKDFASMEPDRLPPDSKVYPDDLPLVELRRDWHRPTTRATDVLAGRSDGAPDPPVLDAEVLARILHLSAGVVRVRRPKPPFRRMWRFRAAGSAGGRFPLELYVSARGVAGIADAVFWYDPVAHALVRIAAAAGGDATTLVITGVPWRTGWKYAERGYRHMWWDAGSMLAQTLAVAESSGLEPRLWTRFADAAIATLVGADGVHELPLALVTLGQGEPAVKPVETAAFGAIADDPREFPLITMVHGAGASDALGDPWPRPPVVPGPVPPSVDLDTVILRRGSARLLDRSASVSYEVFAFTVGAGLAAARTPHAVVVHSVDGMRSGLYRWPVLGSPVLGGVMRDRLVRVCWDQDLGGDAAFVAIGAVDMDAVDDRGYGEAQLDAGIVEGRLHLAAYAQGIGASGMTFLDDELEALLADAFGGPSLAGLLMTCVGVPEYRNRSGGMPCRPVEILTPTARETPR